MKEKARQNKTFAYGNVMVKSRPIDRANRRRPTGNKIRPSPKVNGILFAPPQKLRMPVLLRTVENASETIENLLKAPTAREIGRQAPLTTREIARAHNTLASTRHVRPVNVPWKESHKVARLRNLEATIRTMTPPPLLTSNQRRLLVNYEPRNSNYRTAQRNAGNGGINKALGAYERRVLYENSELSKYIGNIVKHIREYSQYYGIPVTMSQLPEPVQKAMWINHVLHSNNQYSSKEWRDIISEGP